MNLQKLIGRRLFWTWFRKIGIKHGITKVPKNVGEAKDAPWVGAFYDTNRIFFAQLVWAELAIESTIWIGFATLYERLI